MRPTPIAALAAALTLTLGLTGLASAPPLQASPVPARSCKMDAIKQSVCIYQAILEDVDKNYPLRGGGGIGRIVQTTSSSYSVHLLQEGREDVRTYEVRVDQSGKVSISGVAEKTLKH